MRCPRAALVSICLALLTAACATVVVPKTVPLANLKPGDMRVPIVDQRPAESRIYRETEGGGTQKFFADDVFAPSPIDLLGARLADSLPEVYRGLPVELMRMDIGFWITPVSGSSPGSAPFYTPPNIPAGAAIIGALIAIGTIYAINRARATESGVAIIEVRIGDKSLRTMQTASVSREQDVQTAVEKAVRLALDDLALQARALDPQ